MAEIRATLLPPKTITGSASSKSGWVEVGLTWAHYIHVGTRTGVPVPCRTKTSSHRCAVSHFRRIAAHLTGRISTELIDLRMETLRIAAG